MCIGRRDSTAAEFGLGLFRVVHVGTTISGGPPMTTQNIAIAVHHLRRVSKARQRAERAQLAQGGRKGRAAANE